MSTKRSAYLIAFAFLVMVAIPFAVMTTAWAADVTRALLQRDVRVENTATAITNRALAFPQSAVTLIDGAFLEADALNSAVLEGDTDKKAMPGSNLIDVKSAFASSTVAKTDETASSTNATPNDMTLMEVSPAVGEAYHLGLHTPGRIVTLTVGTAGDGTWSITWEYWNGSAWAEFVNVVDNTDGFTTSGTQTITWDMPIAWATSTENGTTAYWSRARVSAFSSIAAQPLGTRARYETGQWWVFESALGESQVRTYSLFVGGPDMQSFHPMMVGPQGITTTDSSTLEPGDDVAWELAITGFFDTSAARVGENIVDKEAAGDRPIRIWVSAENEVTARIEDADLVTALNLVLSGITPGAYALTLDHSTTTNDHTFAMGSNTTTSVAEITDLIDNAAVWEWAQGGTMPYIDSIVFTGALTPLLAYDVAAAADDGYVQLSAFVYPPTGTPVARVEAPDSNIELITVRRGLDGSLFEIVTGLVRWDTSSLPDDATVLSASVRLDVRNIHNNDGRNLTADWYDVWPIDTADYSETAQTGALSAAIGSVTCGTPPACDADPNYNTFTLTNASNVSLTGFTGLRFHVDGGEPTAQNLISWDSYDAAGATQARLSVTYRVPTATTDFGLLYQATTTPSLTIFDRAGNGNTGNFTFPPQSNGTNVTVTMQPLTSPNTPQRLSRDAINADIAGEIASLPALTGEDSGSFLPLFPLVSEIMAGSGSTGIPIRVGWTILAALVVVVAMMVAAPAGAILSLSIGGILLVAFSQMGDGLIPLWVFFVYLPMAVGAVFVKQRLAT